MSQKTPITLTTTKKRHADQQDVLQEQSIKKNKHDNMKKHTTKNSDESDEEIDIFDDQYDEMFYQNRTIPYDMLEKLCSWIEQSNMSKKDQQRWMSHIFVWNEAYQGCRDNENHWHYRSENPDIAEAFIKVHNKVDMETFKQLECFKE